MEANLAEGEEMPEYDESQLEAFDEDEFNAKFDDENFPVDIPDQVEDDVDNDFNLTIEEQPAEE